MITVSVYCYRWPTMSSGNEERSVEKIQQISSSVTGGDDADGKIQYKVADAVQVKLLEENRKSQEQETYPVFRDVWPQIFAGCIAYTLVVQVGINLAFSAVLLPQVMDPDSPLQVDKDQATWIASLMVIATPFGALTCGPLMDMWGRRIVCILTCIPLVAAWYLMAFCPDNVWFLYASRTLSGFGAGMTTTSLVYISEITHKQYRPMMLCVNSVAVSLGILLITVLGSYLPWKIVSFCCGCFTVISLICTIFIVPESPYWILSFNNKTENYFEKAKQSLRWLYPNGQMFLKEWQNLVDSKPHTENPEKDTEAQEQNKGLVLSLFYKAWNHINNFSKPSAYKPLFLLMVIFMFQQVTGSYPIIFYATHLFRAVGSDFDEYTALIMMGLLRFVMSLIVTGLSKVYGRRPLMMTSALGMTIFSLVTAMHLTGKTVKIFDNVNQTSVMDNSTGDALVNTQNCTNGLIGVLFGGNWVGMVGILMVIMFSAIGFLVIPWTLIGEILPISVRGVGGGLMVSYAYIIMFMQVKSFPYMIDLLQMSGTFYMFSLLSLVSAIHIYFFLPETLGKRFDEIEAFFSPSRTQ